MLSVLAVVDRWNVVAAVVVDVVVVDVVVVVAVIFDDSVQLRMYK